MDVVKKEKDVQRWLEDLYIGLPSPTGRPTITQSDGGGERDAW